ncbi:lysylphosphatidylglycerol synthase transmembrane domain-containing protein [Schinkia sp. CFF1]
MKRFSKKFMKPFISSLFIVLFIVLTIMFLDVRTIRMAGEQFIQNPLWLFIMLFLYFLSFCLKALAWERYLRGRVSFLTCLLGILYSLFINHLFPIKIGDFVRAEILYKREKLIKRDEAFHSVIALRAMDMICLIGIAFVGLFALDITYEMPIWLILGGVFFATLALYIVRRYFASFLNRQIALLKSSLFGINGAIIFLATLLSWVVEASVLYGTVHILKGEATFLELVFVNSLTIAGQIFQVTPGGIANYESVMVFGLGIIGINLHAGYTIAIINHAIKFFFSYLVGMFCLVIHPIHINTVKKMYKTERS